MFDILHGSTGKSLKHYQSWSNPRWTGSTVDFFFLGGGGGGSRPGPTPLQKKINKEDTQLYFKSTIHHGCYGSGICKRASRA